MSLEGDLHKETKNWSLPVVVRTFENDDKGQKHFQEEAAVLGQHGYTPQTQSEEGGHIHAGRLILTGGFSVLAGRRGIRSKGKLNVTFMKAPASPEPAPAATDPMAQLRQLGELRDAGVITPEEFDAKKAEILGRM